jgi:putative heme-binding domain-containing protein
MRKMIGIGLLAACVAVPALAQRGGGAPAPANPFAGNQAAIQEGEGVFNQNCTMCHGARGAGGELGPALASGWRNDARGSDAQLFNTIKNGIRGTAMPAWGGKLMDDQIWKIAAYIHVLRGTAIDNPLPGDVARGEQIFLGKGECSGCHMVNGKGGLSGPDLSNIASMRKVNSIQDALTKQEHRIFGPGGAHLTTLPPLDTYPPVQIVTSDGKTHDGVLMNEDGFSLQLLGSDQQLHTFDRAKVRTVTQKARSIMPTDYDKRLAPDEFKDLMAYLTRLGTAPTAQARRGGGAAPAGGE